MQRGTLVVLSGPSGSGKGTLVNKYRQTFDDVFVSVSATTRDPREGEKHGVNYYFMTVDEFLKKRDENGFLEHADFCGNYYGTPREDVEKALAEGKDVILEIEVQGALKVKNTCPEAVFVFTLPPTFEILRERLIGRGTESMEVVEKRLERAREEIKLAPEYDYLVINDTVDNAVEELRAIINVEKCKMKNNLEFIKEF